MAAPEPPPAADTPDHRTTWAQALSAAIERAEINQLEFAKRSGINPSTVTRWLNGETTPRHADVVIEIADVLAPDRTIELLYAAGFTRTADLIRRETTAKPDDPMIERILRADALTDEQRKEWIEEYRRGQNELAHYFALRLADADRRRRAKRAQRGRPDNGDDNGDHGHRAAL